jgi:hypothetical protein
MHGYPADRYPAARYPEDGYPANGLPANGSAFALVRCPSCGKRGRDLKRCGYCARCDAFTMLCDAGRSITAESMLKAENWAHTCTGLAPTRYRLRTLAGDLVEAQLCPAHVAAAARAGLELVPVRPGRTARHVLPLHPRPISLGGTSAKRPLTRKCQTRGSPSIEPGAVHPVRLHPCQPSGQVRVRAEIMVSGRAIAVEAGGGGCARTGHERSASRSSRTAIPAPWR